MKSGAYQGASAEAIRHHYDLSNEFYALWLDETLTYSCALYHDSSPDEPLADAQRRKLDYHASQACTGDVGRVLDVGCGWGSMMRRLIDCHNVSSAVGLTLSLAQAEAMRALGDECIEVRIENWIDHEPDAPYGAIISIGAFEHFAGYAMKRAERVAAYREFFSAGRRWLVPGGRLSLQTITKGSNLKPSRGMVRDMLFIIDRIFPGSELPRIAEIFEATEGLFELISARNDPDDYARTCRTWQQNLVANRAGAESIVGAETVADYRRYLGAAADAFTKRHLGLVRIALERT